MSWVRRHPFVTAIFAIIFAFFVFAAIVGAEDEERTEAILGLIIIYVGLVGVYALAAWLYGKITGRSEPQVPVPPIPPFPHQQFPQWDWSKPTSLNCWRCGAPNPAGAAFCDQCGARLATTAPVAPPIGAIQCPRCGMMLSPQVRFCTNCGLPRTKSPAPAS